MSRGIAIVRLRRGLGEQLCIVPALRSVKAGAGDEPVVVVGDPTSAWLQERFPYLIDEWLPVSVGSAVPHSQCALAIQMHGADRAVTELTCALGADDAGGYHSIGERPPAGRWFPWPERGHEIVRFANLARALGFPDEGVHLELPALPDDDEAAATTLDELGDDPFVVVHPGAPRSDRRWEIEHFAEESAWLAAAGWRIVVTGSAGDAHLAAELEASAGCAVVPALGTTLGAAAAIVRRAEAVLANDTGLAHLAVACGTRTVVVITTSDADRWGPIDQVTHQVVHARHSPTIAVELVRRALENVLSGPLLERRGA